jgi:hypothetical protein
MFKRSGSHIAGKVHTRRVNRTEVDLSVSADLFQSLERFVEQRTRVREGGARKSTSMSEAESAILLSTVLTGPEDNNVTDNARFLHNTFGDRIEECLDPFSDLVGNPMEVSID